MYARMSWAATPGRVSIGAQHGRNRFIGPKPASSVKMMRSRRRRRAAARRALLTASGKPFFKSILRRQVALGMERTRHQFAPAVPVQEVIDRAVAGRMPDRFLVGCLEIVDVQHLAGARRFGKTREHGVLFGQRHVFVLSPPIRLCLAGFDTPLVVGPVPTVHPAHPPPHPSPNPPSATPTP